MAAVREVMIIQAVIRANRKVVSSKQKVLAKHAGKHLIAKAMNVSQEPIAFYHRRMQTVHIQSQ